MAEPSIFEKIISRKRLLEGIAAEPSPPPKPSPPSKPKIMKRVPYRDPETQKILWKDVPEE